MGGIMLKRVEEVHQQTEQGLSRCILHFNEPLLMPVIIWAN